VRRDVEIEEANAKVTALLVAAETEKKGSATEAAPENSLKVKRADLATDSRRAEARTAVVGRTAWIELE
jgi:hypothetical protein